MTHRRIRVGWTCCDRCHTFHRNRVFAFLHYVWLVATRRT